MKRINFNKLTKIMILVTCSIVIIMSFFTYQDYQKAKQLNNDDSPVKLVADSINDDLKISSYHVEDAINSQFERIHTNTYIVYDNELKSYLPAGESWMMSVNNNDKVSVISLKQLSYDKLKALSKYLSNQLSKDETPMIEVTFNYDQINDGIIEVSQLSYLAFDEQVILDHSNNSTINGQLLSLDCPLITIEEYDDDQDNYIYSCTLPAYESLESCFKKNYLNLDHNGYFQEVVSGTKDSPDTITSSICIQELSGKYSQHADFNELYGRNEYIENGYLVWYQFNGIYQKYTFFDYLTTHYYNYLLSLGILLFIFIVTKKIIDDKPQPTVFKAVKNNLSSPVKELPIDLEEIDIALIISKLINDSSNILTFKKINISYHPQKAIFKGNREQITELITKLYNFSLRYSNQQDLLSIEVKNNELVFSNPNFNYTTSDLESLDDCIKIIKDHQYHYSFTKNKLLLTKKAL